MSSRRALVLLVVIGVLGVLVVLAAAFVTLAQLERKSSQQRLQATRALFLARAGLEDAMARLGAGQDPGLASLRYDGEDYNDDGVLSPGLETAAQMYQPAVCNREDCPVRMALRPSFSVKDPTGLPALVNVDGRVRGYSGRLSPDPASAGSTYALKVSSQEGLYVNGGDITPGDADGDGILNARDVDAGGVPNYNAVLKRMFGDLAKAMDEVEQNYEDPDTGDIITSSTFDDLPVSQADGEKLILLRPAGGWTSWEQIRDLALGGSQAKLDALKPYLALHAWVDTRVIRPDASTFMVNVQPKSWAEIKNFGGRGVPALEARAPVSLAWARTRRPVLMALLSNLKGIHCEEGWVAGDPSGMGAREMFMGTAPDSVGRLKSASLTNAWDGTDICHAVVSRLLAWTGPLDTWEAWDAFCNAIPDSCLDQNYATNNPPLRDLLKANFNPNSDLNKFNPNRSSWKRLDKQDLVVYSTEFSLLPTLEARDLVGLGRVVDPRGRVMAVRELALSLAAPMAARLTTQREFVCADLGDLQKAGDEKSPRLPDAYLSPNAGMTRSWGGRVAPTSRGQGVSLQTYPEPYVNPGAGLQISPADYDGNLQLATLETKPDDFYHLDQMVPAPPTLDMKMLASFDDGFDLHNPGTDVPGPNLPDTKQVTTAELGNSLLDPLKPNTLYPDGAYSERDRMPAYLDAGNAHGFHGLMSFWVKANYDFQGIKGNLDPDQRGHRWVSWTTYLVNTTNTGYCINQFFTVGEVHKDTYGIFGMFETGHSKDDVLPDMVHGQEHRYTGKRRSLCHRWDLVTFYWDFQDPDTATMNSPDSGEMVLDDGAGATNVGHDSDYLSYKSDPTLASDLLQPDLYGAHRIELGSTRKPEYYIVGSYMGNGADATLDEFAIYDLGALGSSNAVDTQTFAQTRFREGRYYKGACYHAFTYGSPVPDDAAASYLSAPLKLPKGSLLRQVAWTFKRPAELPGDYAAVELVKDDLGSPEYLWSANQSSSYYGVPPGSQRWDVRRLVPGAFRARVLFLRKPSPPATDAAGTMDPNTPLLDSPVFDDLTLVYDPPGGVRILSWGGGA